jgi:hypothetical protein
MSKIISCLALVLMFAQTSFAADRIVRCEISSENKTAFKGKCVFSPEEKGSFSLSNIKKQKPLYPGISVVSVTIIEPGVAEVRGLTSDGINSRWGEAKRSEKDKACWVGEDFKVCAR